MLSIKKQISILYISSVLQNLSLTGAWIAILAARGFSLVEIGFVETVFHITSFLFEIPSGVLADLYGRKNMMIVSSVLNMIGNIAMILSRSLPLICISIAFFAVSYNFSSGSGDALAYDSLKTAGREPYYETYASNQLIIYRLFGGISTLCAGFALFIGYKAAYGTDILVGFIQILILLSLHEAPVSDDKNERKKNTAASVRKEFAKCFGASVDFLKKERFAVSLMFCNSFIGAVDILLLFFLQAKLQEAGMPDFALGFALFFMETGGILGAKLILKCKKARYRHILVCAALLVLSGVIAEHSGMYVLMTLGGFAAAFSDDALQVRTNTILQDMFPSKQRATLISIESFTFSVLMIVMSPLAGILFSHW